MERAAWKGCEIRGAAAVPIVAIAPATNGWLQLRVSQIVWISGTRGHARRHNFDPIGSFLEKDVPVGSHVCKVLNQS